MNGNTYNGEKLAQLPQAKLQEIIQQVGTNTKFDGYLVFANKAGEILGNTNGSGNVDEFKSLYNPDLYHKKNVNGKSRLIYKGTSSGK